MDREPCFAGDNAALDKIRKVRREALKGKNYVRDR
ncbi:MAG: hypothetical protein JWO99_709 [Candidatus Saccharibacteria bacterium]|nr:hypothetical protein [Candidatus Saccharibacteria bacterium]